jgi:hypothetical protein
LPGSETRPWSFAEVVDWFETEGSVFKTSEDGKVRRIRVVVSSQLDDDVIRSIWEYLRKLGFHPCFRPMSYIMKMGLRRKRAAECELLSNLEQECFLEHTLPYLRTEKRRKEVVSALSWLGERRRLPGREFRPFTCPKELQQGNQRDHTRGPFNSKKKPL